MESMTPNIVLLLLIVLVPVIPAYILFRLLPNKAFVKGPLQGLKVDLSGSFAGYFLLFLVLISVRSSFQSANYEEWTAKGRITLSDGTTTLYYVDPRYVTFSTPAVKSDSSGNFSLTFLVTSDGRYDFPYMYITMPEYEPKEFFLGPKDKNGRKSSLPISIDSKRKVVDIGTVQLVRLVRPTTTLPSQQNASPLPGTSPYVAQTSH